jgi:hypothetical protein
LSIADQIIASDPVSARFRSPTIDYPQGEDVTIFLPTVGEYLGDDNNSLRPASTAGLDASPSVWRYRGSINIESSFDTIPDNDTIDVSFGIGSDDGSRLRIGGKNILSLDGIGVFFPGESGLARFRAEGVYPLEIVHYDHFGGIGIEFSSSIIGGRDNAGPDGTVGIVPGDVLLSAVPIPAGLPLMVTAVAGLMGLGLARARSVRSRQRRAAALRAYRGPCFPRPITL